MPSIFGSKEFWASNGKSFLISLGSFVVTYATSVLVPDLQKEGLVALAGLVAIAINAIQKAFRLPTPDK